MCGSAGNAHADCTELPTSISASNETIPTELNRQRLDRVTLASVCGRSSRKPDLLFATGDLVEHGDAASYRTAAPGLLAASPVPVSISRSATMTCASPSAADLPGNADRMTASSNMSSTQGPLRFVVLDTLEEGRHGGGFCAGAGRNGCAGPARCGAGPCKTVLILHHPPIETGIAVDDHGAGPSPGCSAWMRRARPDDPQHRRHDLRPHSSARS